MDVKTEFLKYLVEKKVGLYQDIDWTDAVERFPGQNARSLGLLVGKNLRKFPIFKTIEASLTSLDKARSSVRKRRENLIFLYDSARGVLDNDVTGN